MRQKPEKMKSSKGLTVEKLAALGHKVRIRHFRYALYRTQETRKVGHDGFFEIRPIVVPSTFRHDPMYQLLPKGGYTHITIQDKNGKYYCLSSACNEEDSFCYNTGVITALDRLSEKELDELGWDE
jgi:hypothetical protein